jgi:hypothetical protein
MAYADVLRKRMLDRWGAERLARRESAVDTSGQAFEAFMRRCDEREAEEARRRAAQEQENPLQRALREAAGRYGSCEDDFSPMRKTYGI